MRSQIIKNNERGSADHGWLKAKHSFSFGSYHNPDRMGFGKLKVINDDRIEPSKGFGTHPHKNMEIITIPLTGMVQHKDSVGNEGMIKSGEVQVMSAGKGIRHSEYNGSPDELLTLLQIWVEPNQKDVEPRYDQKEFDFLEKQNQWTQVISPMDSASEGLKIYQNAFFNLTRLQEGRDITYEVQSQGNGLYVFVIEGSVQLEGSLLGKRDAMEITDVAEISLKAQTEASILIIEVPI